MILAQGVSLSWRLPRLAVSLAVVLVVGGCAQETTKQTSYLGTSATESKAGSAAAIHAELGQQYLQKGSYKLSMRSLNKAIELDPELASAYLYRGMLLSEIDEFPEAEIEYNKAIALDPAYSRAHANFGVFLCERRRFNEAELQFNQALQDPLYENVGPTLENMGLCALGAGQPGKAEAYFKAALQQDPFLARSLFELAQVSYDSGDARTAKLYLERLRKVAPQSPATLWLGIHVERSLGNKDAEASLILVLEGTFPRSAQAQQLAKARSGSGAAQ